MAGAPTRAGADAAVGEFLIARGGPFWEVQRRLGLLHERAPRTPGGGSRAVPCAAGATRYQRAVERELLGRSIAAPEGEEAPPPAGLPDPSSMHAQVGKPGTLPVSRTVLVPLDAAACCRATLMAAKDVLRIVKGLLR